MTLNFILKMKKIKQKSSFFALAYLGIAELIDSEINRVYVKKKGFTILSCTSGNYAKLGGESDRRMSKKRWAELKKLKAKNGKKDKKVQS